MIIGIVLVVLLALIGVILYLMYMYNPAGRGYTRHERKSTPVLPGAAYIRFCYLYGGV